jgi:hypothetical protein
LIDVTPHLVLCPIEDDDEHEDENSSRRDAVKVAQYEVLGYEAKRHACPARDAMKVAHHFSGG